MRQTKYSLIYAPETFKHLEYIDRKYHRLIETVLEQQLCHEPGHTTRNRKPLERLAFSIATWELRFGPENRFRVFYQIQNMENTVWILAIGIKKGNRLFIGGKEIII